MIYFNLFADKSFLLILSTCITLWTMLIPNTVQPRLSRLLLSELFDYPDTLSWSQLHTLYVFLENIKFYLETKTKI